MPGTETSYLIAPSADSTVAVEITKNRFFRERRCLLVFDSFRGEMIYAPNDPASGKLNVNVDAGSVLCRDKRLTSRRKQRRYESRAQLMLKKHVPNTQISFISTQVSAKRLRGFVAEGVLTLGSISRTVQVNLVLSPKSHGRVQIDADATIRLSDFDLKPDSRFFGLIQTKDQVLVRFLFWATPASTSANAGAVGS